MTQTFRERRRYFRVNDTLDISCRLMEADDAGKPGVSGGRKLSERWLHIENDIQIALEKVRKQSSDVADLLALFNQKISLMGSDEHADSGEEAAFQHSVSVNISACGIAFCLPVQFAVGASLQLKLRLYPNMIELSLPAVVIACEDRAANGDHPAESGVNSDEPFLIRADFVRLDDNMQEILIQHVLKCQTRELKQRRQARQSD